MLGVRAAQGEPMTEQRERTAPAGWFTDPVNRALLRWWDGIFWTTEIFDPQDIPPPSVEALRNSARNRARATAPPR
jgi:hypothetical protein